jgi:hypothetical protein
LLHQQIHCDLVLLPTADDRGRLVKATRLKGIKDFKATQFGLHPIALDVWGHFVFLHLQGGKPAAATAAAAAAAGHEANPDQQQQQAALPSVGAWLGESCLSSSYPVCVGGFGSCCASYSQSAALLIMCQWRPALSLHVQCANARGSRINMF